MAITPQQQFEEVRLTPDVLTELEKVGIREGGMVGTGAGAFTLTPTGSLRRPVSVLSTDKGRETVDDIRQKIQPPEQPIETKPVKEPEKPTADDLLVNQEIEAAKSDIEKRADEAINSFNAIIDPYLSGLDIRKQQQIESVKQTFTASKQLLMEANERRERIVQTAGIRAGAARFTPETQAGVMAAEARQSALFIADLAAKERAAISAIETAFDEKQFTVGVTKFQELQKIQEKRDKKIDELEASALKRLGEMEERNRILNIETVISEEIKKGNNDSLDILDTLNKQNLAASIKDINNFKTNLRNSETSEKLQGIAKEFVDLQSIGQLPFDATIEDYLDIKDPTRHLDIKLKEANLQKTLFELANPSLLNPKQLFDAELKLAKDFEGYAKNLREANRQIRIIHEAHKEAKNRMLKGESINAASQGVLVAFQKLLDPDSVVRESEYARSPSGLALVDRIEGFATKIKQGGAGLTAEALGEFVALGERWLEGYQNDLFGFAQRTQNQAKSIGADLTRVLTSDVIDLLNNLPDKTNDESNLTDEEAYEAYLKKKQ